MSFDFFASTLPDTGFYCIGTLNPAGGFKHRWFDNKEKAYEHALYMDETGETVYFAQGSFKEPTNRKSENAAHFCTFFLDIDCEIGRAHV